MEKCPYIDICARYSPDNCKEKYHKYNCHIRIYFDGFIRPGALEDLANNNDKRKENRKEKSYLILISIHILYQ